MKTATQNLRSLAEDEMESFAPHVFLATRHSRAGIQVCFPPRLAWIPIGVYPETSKGGYDRTAW